MQGEAEAQTKAYAGRQRIGRKERREADWPRTWRWLCLTEEVA
jgi:hypothetical protein